MLSFGRDRSHSMYVEFYGVPRQRARIFELEIQADTLGELLGALARRIPSLSEFMDSRQLHPSFAANLNGNRFVSDPRTPLRADDRVLILSADAGG